MIDTIVSLSKEFISIKSDPDNAEELSRILKLAISPLKNFTIEHFEKNGSKSVLVYNTPKRPQKFKVILNGHLDVVPGKEHQYIPKIENTRLYGVGSMDMKAAVACLIIAFKDVARQVNYPLGLQMVTDEEIGGFNGTKYQIDEGVRADFVIAGETTNLNIVNRAKGICWLKISSKGKTAHGAYPWKGENAIWKMNEFLTDLKKQFPILTKQEWKTTLNLSRIETTNKSFNKIPDDCDVSLDIRYIPEESAKIIPAIKKLLPKGFKLEIVMKEPALFVDEKNAYLQLLKKIDQKIIKREVSLYGAQGSSDSRHFTRINCAGIEFGPSGGAGGMDNEWVDIASLEKYYQVIKEFLLSI